MVDVLMHQHYGGERLAERILETAEQSGLPITPEALAPADEFHTRGINATLELGSLAELQSTDRVLDVGSGLGGPARVLAQEFGCTVVGVDITPEFVRSAEILTERCGLSDRVSFRLGDALDLPFGEAEFDVAWTQHVVMNIRERGTLYWDIYRVLKPGGRLVFCDILRGEEGPLPFPLPWATDPELSFLYNAEETRGHLRSAGFIERIWRDVTDDAMAWMEQQTQRGPGGSPLNLQIVMGQEMPQRLGNLAKATREGLVRYVQSVWVKPETLAT